MKNITLSIPDELLQKSREYAKKNGTTVNNMVRILLKNTIEAKSGFSEIENSISTLGIKTRVYSFNRDELYER
ncbi:MAG: DUF6364 family protein [Marinoscillum sp.]|uniref:DUF6364 family protein n=1 Tax=Marinoscillum sp. TaxID=2024838 RepID=UPI0032FF8F5F